MGFRAPLLFSHPLAKGPRNLQLGLLVVAGLAIADVSTVLGVSTAMGVSIGLALLGSVGLFGVLKDMSGAFWQLDRFVISLPNWPENRPMFNIKPAHCLTFCPKASCCSSVSGPACP